MLVLVCSLREGNFNTYSDGLNEISPWFFTLDHTNYARGIPVHLRDMMQSEEKHPDMAKAFADGKFTVQKTKHALSRITVDHAHEENNAVIKGEGRVVGITDNPNALH